MVIQYLKQACAAVLERMALNHLVGSDFGRAARLFEKIRRLQPDRKGIRYNLGISYLSLGRNEEAEALFLEERRRQGDSYPLLRALADLAFMEEKREKAGEFYRLAGELASGEKLRSYLALRQKICQDEERFAGALESAQNNARGSELMAEGRYPEAEETFRRAVEKDPSNFQALNNLGAIAMNVRRDHDEAAQWFGRAQALVDLPLLKRNLRQLKELKER